MFKILALNVLVCACLSLELSNKISMPCSKAIEIAKDAFTEKYKCQYDDSYGLVMFDFRGFFLEDANKPDLTLYLGIFDAQYEKDAQKLVESLKKIKDFEGSKSFLSVGIGKAEGVSYLVVVQDFRDYDSELKNFADSHSQLPQFPRVIAQIGLDLARALKPFQKAKLLSNAIVPERIIMEKDYRFLLANFQNVVQVSGYGKGLLKSGDFIRDNRDGFYQKKSDPSHNWSVDFKSEIFAIGKIMLILATGRNMDTFNSDELDAELKSGTIKLNPYFLADRTLFKIILKCLSNQTEKRSDLASLITGLENYLKNRDDYMMYLTSGKLEVSIENGAEDFDQRQVSHYACTSPNQTMGESGRYEWKEHMMECNKIEYLTDKTTLPNIVAQLQLV